MNFGRNAFIFPQMNTPDGGDILRICITAEGPDLKSPVGKDLGHSPYFLVIDPETLEFEVYENEAAGWDMGAGMKAADIIIGLGVDAVITGGIGFHGYDKLTGAGIMVISDEEGPVLDAINNFKRRHMQ